MRARSAITGYPDMSFPRTNARFPLKKLYSLEAIISERYTVSLCWFESSIPITFFPGMGATRAEKALIDLAISSDKLIIRDAFIPAVG
ncbi:hypothetical protein HYD_2340 [Candidatus Hydrogenosomobacter endosymbioticus]|uniref:Uncharacterized protein n=1 Tax=Candidatus Hydrogenosomobacter endosymbioticus TaxID=2558174 RepID=A0ABM7V8K9_9PROT|nr:hypothetical protein HYD_2340 [Candidatus Hydrogenosomobacter endosymbioticus]